MVCPLRYVLLAVSAIVALGALIFLSDEEAEAPVSLWDTCDGGKSRKKEKEGEPAPVGAATLVAYTVADYMSGYYLWRLLLRASQGSVVIAAGMAGVGLLAASVLVYAVMEQAASTPLITAFTSTLLNRIPSIGVEDLAW